MILSIRLQKIKLDKMKTFKNIIVATDFSESATNAYHYARQIASHLNASLTVMNVFELPVLDPGVPNVYATMPSIDELQKAAEKRLSNFIRETEDDSDTTMVASRVEVKIQAHIGFPADKLIELSENPDTDLIILGTVGEQGWLTKLFGSVAIKVMQEAQCPVLLVPQSAEYKNIHHILYAASPESASNKTVGMAIDFAKHFVSAIHFVHIDAVFENPKSNTSSLFKKVLEGKAPNLPYTIENVAAQSVGEGVSSFCLKNHVDLVISVTHHRKFWDNLIHHSISKDLVWQAHLPILCLHTDDKVQPPV
jgi:nucleotide-binding universal stress UspA family protein